MSAATTASYPSSSSLYPMSLSRETSSSTASSYTTRYTSRSANDAGYDSPRYREKGKGRAMEVPEVHVERTSHTGESSRTYPPPKQPLSPRQLGRIAQSFGIVIPSLPLPSPTHSPGFLATAPPIASPRRSPRSVRSAPALVSQHLLCVIPPISLLNLSSPSPEEAEAKRRRWRRGRLIPLQPTLGQMLLAIAKEFGLPSIKGLQVYMANNSSGRDDRSSFSGSSFGSLVETPGPQISAQSWPALFAQHYHPAASRHASPSQTPDRQSGPLQRELTFPLSPLAMLAENRVRTKLSYHKEVSPSMPTTSTSNGGALISPSLAGPFHPPSPSSATETSNASFIATVEFDVDTDEAAWYNEWMTSGRVKKPSVVVDGAGMRELRLVKKAQGRQQAARFLTEMDSNTVDRYSIDSDARLAHRKRSGKGSLHPAKSLASLQRADSKSGERLVIQQPAKALSSSGSMGNLHEAETSGDDSTLPDFEDEMDDHLADPIHLGGFSPRLKQRLVGDVDKRGSAMVMSDELDDLEKVMRQLSPRDIRLTSPRMLTPRMAAKVSTLEMPMVPRSSVRPGRSPLGEAFKPAAPQEVQRPAKLQKASLSDPPPSSSRVTDAPSNASGQAQADLPRPTWPAVPFVKLGSAPGSPSSINDLFAEGTRPSAGPNVSPETTSRMRPHASSDSGEWKPARPVRPPSPNIVHAHTPSRELDPEVLDILRSPKQQSGSPAQSPASPGDSATFRQRANSISLKGLKHMGSRTFHRGSKDKHVPPPLPLNNTDPVGLFRAPVSPAGSTFPGLRDKSSSATPPVSGAASEFGSLMGPSDGSPRPNSNSLPAQSGAKHGFGRLFNPFARRPSDNSTKKQSKRSPSMDANASPHIMQISAPLPSSFTHNSLAEAAGYATVDLPGSPMGLDRRPTLNKSPPVPTSPKSIKRKPVPGSSTGLGERPSMEDRIKESMSLGSMASFALEDLPRRRQPAVQHAM